MCFPVVRLISMKSLCILFSNMMCKIVKEKVNLPNKGDLQVCTINNHGFSVSRLEGFVSNREQSYEDPIEE